MTEEEIYINVCNVIKANNCTQLSDLTKVMQILYLYGPTLNKDIAETFAREILTQNI